MTGPRLIDVLEATRSADTLDLVQEHLRQGDCWPIRRKPCTDSVAFPSARHRQARELKERDRAKPMLLLVPDRVAVSDLTWTSEAIELADVFWPGSVTLVLSDPGARYPHGVRGSDGSVAVAA